MRTYRQEDLPKNERAMKPLHKLDNFAQQNAGDTSWPSQNSWRILILLMSEMSVFWMKFHWNVIPWSVYFKSASNNEISFAPNRRGTIAWSNKYLVIIPIYVSPPVHLQQLPHLILGMNK